MDQSESLSDVLSEFARTMLTDFPIQAILDHLVQRIVEVLPIASAGVTLISAGRNPHLIAASDNDALRYERLQTEVGEGPCVRAYQTGEAVSVPDLARDDRFPVFGPLALEAGLVAAFTFPLRHAEKCLGALDLYSQSPQPLDDATMIAAQTLADVAAAYLLNAQRRDDARNSSDRYRESALHDALTGLPNRVLLHERLAHAMGRSRRSHKLISILFVDLDRFKYVNDMYGHRVGDELLVSVADRLRRLVRPGDTVARMSGDEFVVLCEDLDSRRDIDVLAERVVEALAKPFALADTEVTVTASVGMAFSGPGDEVPEQVLDDADEAMYQAKRAGGARHQLIDLGERSRTSHSATLQRELRGAMSRGELRLDYQPIVRTTDERLTSIEALLRWDHPQRGLVSPDTIIPLAEQSGLIIDIGRWVLERACSDHERLRQVSDYEDLEIAVNVSPHQLMARDGCEWVENVLSRKGTDPRLVTLEMTESVYLEDSERAMVVLSGLKSLGVGLALDDFGTGYSSLVYLQRFPIDIVKIDRRFISHLANEPASASIVGAIINLAHVLHQVVVAEGVETADQRDQLATLGCDSCQGYYFARPMSIDDLERHLLSTEAAPPVSAGHSSASL